MTRKTARNRRGIVSEWRRKTDAVANLLDAAKRWPPDDSRVLEALRRRNEADATYRQVLAEDRERREVCARAFAAAKRAGLSDEDIANVIGHDLTTALATHFSRRHRERAKRKRAASEASAVKPSEAEAWYTEPTDTEGVVSEDA
jgi:hypothetical protein